jgi:hypothetical protein
MTMTMLAWAYSGGVTLAGGLAAALLGTVPAHADAPTATTDAGSTVSTLQIVPTNIEHYDGLFAVHPLADSSVRQSR